MNISAEVDPPPAMAISSLTVGLRRSSATLIEAEEREDELVELGHLAVREDDRPVGVDADGEVVGDEPLDVLREVRRGDAVGDRLVVGDQDEQLDAELLQPDAVLERPEVGGRCGAARWAGRR